MEAKKHMNFFHQYIDLIIPGVIVTGFYGLTLIDVETIVKIAVGAVTLGYMIHKWFLIKKVK